MKRVLAAAAAFAAVTGGAVAQEAQDPFILQIDIGRKAVFVDRMMDAAGIDIPHVFRAEGVAPDSAEGLWLALREVGRDAVIMREIYCARRLVGPKTCARAVAPGWIGAEPTPAPSLATLRAHEEELGRYMAPFVDRACAIGKARTKDSLYCSVE